MGSGAESGSDDADIKCCMKIEELHSKISASAIEEENLPSFMDWALREIGKSMELTSVEIAEFDSNGHALTGMKEGVFQWKEERL